MAKSWMVGIAAVALVAVGSSQAVKAQPFTWTGCYIGGNAGLGTGAKTFRDASTSQFFIDFQNSVASVNDGIFGGFGGGQVGCDYQFAPHYVIGLQGNFDAADISGSVTDTSNPNHPVLLDAKTSSLFGLVGRVGYAQDAVLFYVDGGAAWAHDSYSAIDTGTISPGFSYGQPTETRTGGVVGVGGELALGAGLSAFLEYDHYFFGTKTLPFPCSTSCGGSTNYVNVSQDVDTFRVGLNLHFSSFPFPPPPPPH